MRLDQECCGGKELPSKSHICCNNYEAVEKTKEEDNNCCFNRGTNSYELFNSQNERCSENGVEPKNAPLMQLICRNTKFEISETDAPYLRCCGRHILDTREHICCGSRKLRLGSEKHQCCSGMQIYRSKFFKCKNNLIVPIDSEVNKTDTQRLCSGSLFYKASELLAQNACTKKTGNMVSILSSP